MNRTEGPRRRYAFVHRPGVVSPVVGYLEAPMGDRFTEAQVDAAWDWYRENARLVNATLAHLSHGDPQILEAMWEDVIPRLPAIWVRWSPTHPSGASRTSYTVTQVRRYASKARVRELRQREGVSSEGEGARTRRRNASPEDRDEVQYILEGLSSRDRELLVMRHMLDMTFEEMGWELDWSKETTRQRYHAAVRRARERTRDAR